MYRLNHSILLVVLMCTMFIGCGDSSTYNEGKDYFLTDYIAEGEEHFGGKLENSKYSFNITRYFHQLLNNEDYTNKLYLVPSGGAVNANRTILPKNKVSFNIIYTEL